MLLHPTKAKVLILHNDDSCHLPRIEINKKIWFDSFEAIDNFKTIKDAMEQELGVSVNVLHHASYQINKEQRQIEGIYVLEQHNPTEEIQG